MRQSTIIFLSFILSAQSVMSAYAASSTIMADDTIVIEQNSSPVSLPQQRPVPQPAPQPVTQAQSSTPEKPKPSEKKTASKKQKKKQSLPPKRFLQIFPTMSWAVLRLGVLWPLLLVVAGEEAVVIQRLLSQPQRRTLHLIQILRQRLPAILKRWNTTINMVWGRSRLLPPTPVGILVPV
jgi:hypothetical protein